MLFGKKQVLHCAACGSELGRHKYKPSADWKMEGLLCSNCHVEKTREFMLKEAEPDHCAMCKKELGGVANKPRWQWEMEPGSLLCEPCFRKKDADYNKKLNFCTVCSTRLGFIRYNPKPAWKLQGQVCKKCWDDRNKK